MKNLKILIDVRMINQSGIGVYIKEVISRLDKIYSVYILINNENQIPKDIIIKGVINVDYSRFSIKNLFLNKVIKKNNIDVYFCPNAAIIPLTKVKIITTIHDMCPVALSHNFGYMKSFLYWIIVLFQLSFSTKIIAISKFTKDEINKYYLSLYNKKITVIYNGLVKRNNNTDNKPIIEGDYYLTVGNIKPHKNIKKLIYDFIQSKSTDKLVIVGQSDGFITGETALPLRNNIVYTGFVTDDELVNLYRNANCYIFPSKYEGFGLPLLEAMSYNLPIICSNIPIFKELGNNKIKYIYNDNYYSFFKENSIPNKIIRYEDDLIKYNWDDSVKKMMKLVNEGK